MKTVVLAEAGSCHEGSLERAGSLINLAYAAGADIVKFQYCSNPEKLATKRGMAYNHYPWSIQKGWMPHLVEHCNSHKLEFACTTYLKEDIEVVAPFVKRFKISAFEKDDDDFACAHMPYNKPIIRSGYRVGIGHGIVDVWELHCISKYPCPDSEARLREVGELSGLSDHTRNPLSGALAVALGAEYIETHFRLFDTSPECPDYVVARNPTELHQYIKNIRQAEVLLG